MKQLFALLLSGIFLAGCSAETEIEQALAFRSRLLSGGGCSFTALVTADYGDELQEFTMECQGDANGAITFEVTQPEAISGITGNLSATGGALTFDDTALHFELMAGGTLSPVSAPWIFLRTLRSGYIVPACWEGEMLHLSIDDSYADDALRLDIWLDGEGHPVRVEILQEGMGILTLRIENFQIL